MFCLFLLIILKLAPGHGAHAAAQEDPGVLPAPPVQLGRHEAHAGYHQINARHVVISSTRTS
jgi:hypothetical protein